MEIAKWILEKGLSSKLDPLPPRTARLSVAWSGTPLTPVVCLSSSERQDILKTVPYKGTDLWQTDAVFGVRIYTYASSYAASVPHWLPSFETARGEHALVVPGFGFCSGNENQWYDGWTAHLPPQGGFATLLPPGQAFRLNLPALTENTQGLSWEEIARSLVPSVEMHRQCLVTAIQTSYQGMNFRNLKLKSFDAEEAIALVLFRQAFLEAEILISHVLPFKQWPKAWKHLKSCLDIKVHSRAPASPSIDLTAIKALIPTVMYRDLYDWLNRLSGILTVPRP